MASPGASRDTAAEPPRIDHACSSPPWASALTTSLTGSPVKRSRAREDWRWWPSHDELRGRAVVGQDRVSRLSTVGEVLPKTPTIRVQLVDHAVAALILPSVVWQDARSESMSGW